MGQTDSIYSTHSAYLGSWEPSYGSAVTGGVICIKSIHKVSHLYFFATLNKERNSSYLQLSRRLNGKMFVFGVSIFQKYTHSPAKNAKKPTCQTIAFFGKYQQIQVP